MHIGIDARLTAYREGGISTYTRQIIQQLARMETRHRYTVLHSYRSAERLSAELGRGTLWTPCHHRLERTALGIELARLGLDVLHSPDFIPPRFGARRYVITVHDLSFMYYPQFMTGESLRYYRDQIEAAVARADHILTISESSRQGIMALLGVPEDKITVQLLGVSADFYPRSAVEVAAMRDRLRLPETYLLFVGTFEPRKNILGLLRAYQMLLADMPDAPPLVIAGSRGWQFEETMRKIEQMQLGERVIWREKIDGGLLPGLYSGALVLLMPSFYEGFGLPALEAMACGTVPVVSGVSSLPEVVGEVGLQVDPNAPESICAGMAKAIEDSDWRAAQAEAARRRASLFTWQKAAEVTRQVYERVLET
jgi:glycosyltransferase involved in cell wall biosynthesis